MATIEVEVPDLKLGDENAYVRKLQFYLLYVVGKPAIIDGLYGEFTEDAVRDFQQTYGMGITGTVGANEWQQLLALPSSP